MNIYSRLVPVTIVLLISSSLTLAERSKKAQEVLNYINFCEKWLDPIGNTYNYEAFNTMYEWAQRNFKEISDKEEREEIIDSLMAFPIVDETALAERVTGMSFAMKEFPEVYDFIENNLDHSNEEVAVNAVNAFVSKGYYNLVAEKIQQYKCYLILQSFPTEEARPMLVNAVLSGEPHAIYALQAIGGYDYTDNEVREILSKRLVDRDQKESIDVFFSINHAVENEMVDQVSNLGFYSADTCKTIRLKAMKALGFFAKNCERSAITELYHISREHEDVSIRELAQTYINDACK